MDEVHHESGTEGVTDILLEDYRPQFHFTPPAKWMNDPNGLVFADGVFHLFYQHHPHGLEWGPMHWGHAISRDLVHWEHRPIALYPDEHGHIFSGSAVVDRENSSGLGTDDNPVLLAIYTYHNPRLREAGNNDNECQAIACSNDGGGSWVKYPGNPVLPNPGARPDFRDPKVFWHQPDKRWIMALAAGDHIEFWHSPNLRQWDYLSSFGADLGAHGGVWECPDLVELPVEGSDQSRWVLLVSINPGGPHGGSATQYFIGHFDGERFTTNPVPDSGSHASQPTEEILWLDYGRDNYAGVTWSNIEDEAGRRLFIGWMSNWDYANKTPTPTWRGAMTLPRQLHIGQTEHGLRLVSRPITALQSLRQSNINIDSVTLAAQAFHPLTGLNPGQCELLLKIDVPPRGSVDTGIELHNAAGEYLRVGFDSAENAFYCDRRHTRNAPFADSFASLERAPRLVSGKQPTLHLFLDRASIELFADNGVSTITDTFFPTRPFTGI